MISRLVQAIETESTLQNRITFAQHKFLSVQCKIVFHGFFWSD